MTSALLCSPRPMTAPTLAKDLLAAGFSVPGTVEDCSKLVQAVVLHAPEVVVCDLLHPLPAWFAALKLLQQAAACPVVLFTHSADADHMAQATDAGVHVYVVQGYGANRLRPLVHLAQARFAQAQQQRQALEALTTRLDERKTVDRAKGILMRGQQLSDDDAYGALRSAAMRSNQRLGQLSQQVIQSAHLAEVVNRSGQLRMLSQRLVKLHLLLQAGVQVAQHTQLLQESVQRVDANFALLNKNVSAPTYGDLLAQLAPTWAALKTALNDHDTQAVDDGAEALLLHAERLTSSLEASGAGMPLQVLNLAGRQRMLSQRFAKCALHHLAGRADAGAPLQLAQQEFEAALTYLNGIPLSTPAIAQALQDAGIAWLHMREALSLSLSEQARQAPRANPAQHTARLFDLAQGSERLLDLFEQLCGHYETSMQLLVG